MAFVERKRPAFSTAEALEIVQSLYRISGSILELPSERDQNFRISDAGGAEYVLKIASALESEETLHMQNKAMERVAARTDVAITQRILRNSQNNDMAQVLDSTGHPHFIRMLTYLQGVPFALFRPHSQRLLHNLGKSLAMVDHALQGFHHPASRRDLRWDFDRAEWVLTHFGRFILEPEKQSMIQYFLQEWRDHVTSQLGDLRKSVVYHDANEYNILVLQRTIEEEPSVRLIDFGDMLFTYTLAEVAIGCAYAMLEKENPLAAALDVVRGYHSLFPLQEKEIDLLFHFVCMRLCLSVCICAFQQQEEPANEYLKISEIPAWDVLKQLRATHPRFATYAFRDVCGLNAHPAHVKVLQWLKKQDSAVPVLNPESLSDPGDVRFHDADDFRITTNEGYAWRSIHLGIDYFGPPGTPVYCLLDGVIHSFRDNHGNGDYGPTIVLEHRTEDTKFWVLYGHLSSDSLLGLHTGKPVTRGSCIGRIGTYEENGNWLPHVHVQMILDMLEQQGTFPGLCTPAEKSIWLNLCPPLSEPENAHMTKDQLLRDRREYISSALSLSYRSPLHIVRGKGQHLYDSEGRVYLDCVNNVAHVGHSHPRVVEAASKQMAELNTNTRYLHRSILEYAERLCATLPEPLRVCFFVCSGSEANDLALRLARAYTRNKNTIVLDGAYHGNLSSLIEISPYKFDGPGGSGAPSHVRKALMPDGYRGPYKYSDPSRGQKYAEDVGKMIALFEDSMPITFIAESAPGCGGQIILPPDYLQHAFEQVRKTDGVCIVDEVQVGFGRPGLHFWCFETQNVVPDIVTMGKPIGNGHPLAAVITSRKIANAFENGMEYFNTFGGNPVSCSVGLAVLDVIEQESLQQNALQVGMYLKERLSSLMLEHSLIGDVRGLGLFLGIELVTDRSTLAPGTKQASYVVERMKERGILLSTDGPLHNVIKIKPPLVFSKNDADWLVTNLDTVLRESPIA